MSSSPSIRLGAGQRAILVPWHALVRGLDLPRARELVRAAFEDPEALARLRELASVPTPASSDDEAVIDRVATMIAAGDLVIVELPSKQRFYPPPAPGTNHAPRLADLATDLDVLPVSLQLLDHDGVAYVDQRLELELPNGERSTITLDGAGRFSLDAVRGPGSCRLWFPDALSLPQRERRRDAMQGFRRSPEDATIARRHPRPVNLPRGRFTRIVVEPPPAQTTRSLPGTLFGFASSCPTAGVAHFVGVAKEAIAADPRNRIGVFGHADAKGSDADNKLLSDRRADIAFALLTGDFQMFRTAATEETWEDADWQALLRALGCNPGAIDGEPGVLTADAIRAFRRDYNEGFFHRDSTRTPAFGELADGDALDDATCDAILDAFHAHHAVEIAPDRFLGPGRAGCGEFNPRSAEHVDNRRVSLAIYRDDAPESAEFPCRRGDASSCDVDDLGAMRCRFYRERIGKDEIPEEVVTFWDFEWLATPTGKAHLSALTSLPDSNEVEIVVQRIAGGEPECCEGEGGVPALGPVLGRIEGLVRRGVLYGLWQPPEGYDPFSREHWFRGPGEQEGDPWQPRFQPPVFAVASGGRWAFGAAPGHRADRIAFEQPPAAPVLVFTSDGKLRMITNPDALRELGTRHVDGAILPRR